MTATDSLGQEITPGAVLVYPGRRGSSLWVNHGVVLRIDQEEERTWRDGARQIPVVTVQRFEFWRGSVQRKPVKLTRLEFVTVLPQWTEAMLQNYFQTQARPRVA